MGYRRRIAPDKRAGLVNNGRGVAGHEVVLHLAHDSVVVRAALDSLYIGEHTDGLVDIGSVA